MAVEILECPPMQSAVSASRWFSARGSSPNDYGAINGDAGFRKRCISRPSTLRNTNGHCECETRPSLYCCQLQNHASTHRTSVSDMHVLRTSVCRIKREVRRDINHRQGLLIAKCERMGRGIFQNHKQIRFACRLEQVAFLFGPSQNTIACTLNWCLCATVTMNSHCLHKTLLQQYEAQPVARWNS
jgi:hypothetical protein